MKIVILIMLEAYCINSTLCYKNFNRWVQSGHTEGDMTIHKNGLSDTNFRWPDKTICYQFSGNFTQSEIALIHDVVNTGFEGTCIKFKSSSCNGNYVNITNTNSGCWSDVGCLGGSQRLNLGEGCFFREIIIHEFLHSLGFYHEQSRSDRDSYIHIILENIDLDYIEEFTIPENIVTFGQPYDYCSIMHYDLYAFTKNGEKTIQPRCPTTCDIGFELELSLVDKNKINIMYDCGNDYPIISVPDPCSTF